MCQESCSFCTAKMARGGAPIIVRDRQILSSRISVVLCARIVCLGLLFSIISGITACGKRGDLHAPNPTNWDEPEPQHPRGHGLDN